MERVPVLMYHRVNDCAGDSLTVTPAVFEAQMRYLRDHGYHTVTCDELLAFIAGEKRLSRAVLLTFDDGWLDTYVYAFPILKKYALKAAFFIIPQWVNEASLCAKGIPAAFPRYKEAEKYAEQGRYGDVTVTWPIVREMIASGLIEVHSHTFRHSNRKNLADSELLSELVAAKQATEKQTNRECRYLCWPWGSYDTAAVAMAVRCGHKGLFTTNSGVVAANSDPLQIKRINVRNDADWFRRFVGFNTNGVSSLLYRAVNKFVRL